MKNPTHLPKTLEIYELFKPVEGFNYVYYGKVRNGKTYAATCDIIDLLKLGEVVVANWDIDFTGFDQRESAVIVFFKLLVGKKLFYKFYYSNFHYLSERDPEFIQRIKEMVGAHVFIDEGQWIFNSHSRKDDVAARQLILEGGHYCRSLAVITQRPQNILKDIRSQVNIWYKCTKKLNIMGFVLFERSEIQEMKDDLPDEEQIESTKTYWARKKIFAMYNTHGRRNPEAVIMKPEFDVVKLGFFTKLWLLVLLIIKPKKTRQFIHDALPLPTGERE